MKLEEAIEILSLYHSRLRPPLSREFRDSVLLLIEAGKEVERLRRVEKFDPTIALPGETTE